MSDDKHRFGKVKYWNPARLFGFILPEGETDHTKGIYFNSRAMVGDYNVPIRGDQVAFTIRVASGKIYAQNVELISTG